MCLILGDSENQDTSRENWENTKAENEVKREEDCFQGLTMDEPEVTNQDVSSLPLASSYSFFSFQHDQGAVCKAGPQQ